MRTGPKNKPTKLKLLQGTFRAHRAVKNEPMPEVAIPPAPESLSPAAKQEWERVTPELYRLGLLSGIDRAALAVYCENWSDWVDATHKCQTVDGVDHKVIQTQNGNWIENPYYSIKKRAAELMHKFMVEFGMTPSARSGIEAAPPGTYTTKPAPQKKAAQSTANPTWTDFGK